MISISTEMGIAMIGSLVTCIGVLFRLLISSKDDQIKVLNTMLERSNQDKEKAIDGWVRTLSTSRTVADAATQAINIAERRNDS